MGLGCTWRALPLSPSNEIPSLLASIDVGTAAYTFRVTDMANIWVESLDRKQICMRAWGENTSIDPSDTPENMKKFLSSLQSALDPFHPDHHLSSMSLSKASGEDQDSLSLNITCNLPGLSSLKWPVLLKKKPSSSLATDLVLPLLQKQYARQREVDLLTDLLIQKDGILVKLLDKLESSGTGLEHVFNSLSHKKKVSRAVAEDKVRGLAPFDKNSWQSERSTLGDEPSNTGTLVNKVFDGAGLTLGTTFEVEDSPKLDNWWHDIHGTLQIPHRSSMAQVDNKIDVKSSHQVTADNDGDDDDDDFQVQELPGNLATKPKETPSAQPLDDVSTASESGEDGGGKGKSPVKAATPPQKGRKIGRLGHVGNRRPTSPPQSQTPPSKAKAKVTVPIDGSDTASEADDEEKLPADVASPPPANEAKVPPRGKIGRIKGRGETPATEEPLVLKQSDEDESKNKISGSPRPPRLGKIGKGPRPESSATASNDNERGRNASVDASTQRETSTERADRRREELKRELEKKAAAGPTKKKRKF